MGTVISIVLLSAHLLAANIAAAGPLAWAWLVGLASIDRDWPRRIARQSIAALLLAISLGALMLASPSEGMRAALERFPGSTYWFAAAELVFSLGCLIAMVRLSAASRMRPLWAWSLALATATNLLYHFPPLMAAIGKLAIEPRWTREAVVNHRALLGLAARPEVLSLWIHFILASVAAGGILAFCAVGRASEGDAAVAQVAMRRFAAAALGATVLQLPVGAWVLLARPAMVQDSMIGGDGWATFFFAAGVLLAIGLLQSLAGVAMGDVRTAVRMRAAGLFVGVAVLMVGALTLSRPPQARQPDGLPPTRPSPSSPAL